MRKVYHALNKRAAVLLSLIGDNLSTESTKTMIELNLAALNKRPASRSVMIK